MTQQILVKDEYITHYCRKCDMYFKLDYKLTHCPIGDCNTKLKIIDET